MHLIMVHLKFLLYFLSRTQKYKTTVPSIVAFNREDKVKPMRTLALKQGDKTDVDLTAFIRAATIPFVVKS